MRLAILDLILWPKDPDQSPRIVHFEPGKINIITGQSATGKSAITWIIDYCLGSDKCSIPKGRIRDLTAWFGLHLKLANTEMLIARRNPEDQQTTTDIFWTENITVAIPPTISAKNARVEDLKNRLNQIAQLPSLDFTGSDDGNYGRPSARDMAAFNFQPQHIVANPHTLFFKADTTEHREKLRTIFPLVLGVIDANTLGMQRELKDTQAEYDRRRRELDARLNAAQAWEAEIESYYLQALSLGLLQESTAPHRDWNLDRYILELQKVPPAVRATGLPDFQQGTNETAVSELTTLASLEDRLAGELGSLRRRLTKLDQLSTAIGDFESSLTGQSDRLQGVGWFENRIKTTHQCPVCAAVHEEPNGHLSELLELAREFQQITRSVHEAPPKLEQEVAVLRQQLREREDAITKVRQKRRGLESASNAEAAERQRLRQIYLFVGRVEQALENVTKSRVVDDLQARVRQLAERIAALKRGLDPAKQRERLDAAVDSVSASISQIAVFMQLEHADENVKLNIRELTLQFTPLSGRTDFLWEVGSGENWVGYHLLHCLRFTATLTNYNIIRYRGFWLSINQAKSIFLRHGRK
jgi:predicted  nucleic acid-binding Zn-ribbon protein